MSYLTRMGELERLKQMPLVELTALALETINQARILQGCEPLAELPAKLEQAITGPVTFTQAYLIGDTPESLAPFYAAWGEKQVNLFRDGRQQAAIVLPVILTMLMTGRKWTQ